MGLPVFERPEMTFAEFQAFAILRPKDVRRALIGGEPILSASARNRHQHIVKTIFPVEARSNGSVRQALIAQEEGAIPGLPIRRVVWADRPAE